MSMNLLALVLLAQLSASGPAPAKEPANAGPRGPSVAGRLYPLAPEEAWGLVQKRIAELRLSVDKVDRENQLLVTKWQRVSSLPWLDKAALPSPYREERVRFHVFVSPFARPARVYVGSLLEASRLGRRRPELATAYNDAPTNESLLKALSTALGTGAAIPRSGKERRELALSLAGERLADDCLRGAGLSDGEPVGQPGKLPLSVEPLVYPGPAVADLKSGAVDLEVEIREDGAIAFVRPVGPALGLQFETSAMGQASLLVYRPPRLDGCPVPAIIHYTVEYRIQQ